MADGLTKTNLFLFIFFFLFATGNAIADESKGLEVKVKMFGFNDAQKAKVMEAVELIKQVVSSEEFKARVLKKKYNGKQGYVDTDHSNEDVYKTILEAAEIMGDKTNNRTMDLELELYTGTESKTIGYTYPNVSRIWMNTKYFNKFKPYQVADNLMHEWLHKLGYKHAIKYSSRRNHSVPYSIGYLVKELAREKYQFQSESKSMQAQTE